MNIFVRRLVCVCLLTLSAFALTVASTWISVRLDAPAAVADILKSNRLHALWGREAFWSRYPGHGAVGSAWWHGGVLVAAGIWVGVCHTMVMRRPKRSYLLMASLCLAGAVVFYFFGWMLSGWRPQDERGLWGAVMSHGVLYLSIAGVVFSIWELIRLSILCRVLKDAAAEL